MKYNGELEKEDIVVDGEISVSDDNPQVIEFYLETWFDVDRKFHIHTDIDDGTWLNIYGKYNPFEDMLRLDCIISQEEGEETFSYVPTETESGLIKDMVAEKLQETRNQTPQEFCESMDFDLKMEGI